MPGAALVTGASGFAGSHLVDLLAAEGAELIAWSRRGGPPPTANGTARWRAVDLVDPADVDAAVAECRPLVVYHCAGNARSSGSPADAGATLEVNVRGTRHLLLALRRHSPAARVIVTGSALVYEPTGAALEESSPVGPRGPYGVSKLAQEMVALRAAALDGLDVLVARSFNHIGPRQSPDFVAASVARQIALVERGDAEPRLLVGNLEASRDLSDVRDTVRAYRLLADRGSAGEVYNVCRGEAVRIRSLVDALVARARTHIEIVVDPSRLRPSDVPMLVGSNRKIAAATGWRPVISLDQSLDDLLGYWRAAVAR